MNRNITKSQEAADRAREAAILRAHRVRSFCNDCFDVSRCITSGSCFRAAKRNEFAKAS